MNSSTTRSTSSTSSTSRYSLLAHEFDTLSPAPDDPPILEREDNSDLSTPAETLQSSPVSSFTSFSTTFPTSPEDNTHKQPMVQSYPFPRPCTPLPPRNQGLVCDGGSEAELEEPATPPTTYAHLVHDKREEASWTRPAPDYQRKRGFPGRARRRFGRVVKEAFRTRE